MENVALRRQILALAGFITFTGAFLLVAQSAQAATITVTNSLDSGLGSLRQAVLNASPGDRIVFSPATFNHAVTITLNSQIEISKSLTIDGAVGNVVTPTLDGNWAFHRILLIHPNTYVVLNRLKFVRGLDSACDVCSGGAIHNEGVLSITASTFISNTSNYNMGGAIYSSGTLTITSSYFSQNTSNESGYGYGGAIFNYGQAYVLDSQFKDNFADMKGGAIFNDYIIGHLIIIRSVFTHNQAYNGAGVFNFDLASLEVSDSSFINNDADSGGGIFNTDFATLTVTNSTFFSNQGRTGGGIYNLGAYAKIAGSTFRGNNLEYGGNGGGGIANYGGQLTVVSSQFLGNCAANTGGGGINNNDGDLIVESSAFLNNTAQGGQGGGIRNGGRSSITNTTFISNTAGIGGGIFSFNGYTKVSIVNSSLISNSAQGGLRFLPPYYTCDDPLQLGDPQTVYGGGIGGENVTLTNTLLAQNLIGGNCAITQTVVSDSGHNLEDANTCGFTNTGSLTNTNPLLGPLNDAGFSSLQPLLPGSPAIDAGDDAACPATDIRGFHRPTGTHCDIGAYEYIGLNQPIYLPIALR